MFKCFSLTTDFQEEDEQQRLGKRKDQKQKDPEDETKVVCSHEESLPQFSNEEVKQKNHSE